MNFVRQQERDQYEKLGRSILNRAFRDESCELSDKGLNGVLDVFTQPSVADLCAQVGAGHLGAREVLEAVYPGVRQKRLDENVVPLAEARHRHKQDEDAVSIKGLIPGMAMHLAECCHPLPGDRIVGIITTGKGVNIHTIDCETLETLNDEPERWLDVSWDAEQEGPEIHVGRISLSVLNQPGALGDLSTVIAQNGGNISNLKITNRSADFFDMLIDVEVRDVKHLSNVIAALRANPAINTAERARG